MPSSDSKITVYNVYKVAMEESQIKPVSDKIFRNIWKECCPEIVIIRPKSDLCKTCHSYYTTGSKL